MGWYRARWYWAACAAVLLAGAGGVRVSAQVQYARGQNVAPVFEGWEHNPDGTYSMVFGYLNRNYEEEVDIPLGPGNTITLGGETFGDRGQPTHFYPRRQRFLFRVVVPKDWDKQQKVVWTLTSRGGRWRISGPSSLVVTCSVRYAGRGPTGHGRDGGATTRRTMRKRLS